MPTSTRCSRTSTTLRGRPPRSCSTRSRPITTTSYPEIGAELTALVEDWQDDGGEAARTEIAYEVKLFTPAQYSAAGFDPATSTPFWSTQGISAPLDYVDGSTPSTESVGETPETPLPNSAYRAYARGRRYFAAAQWGAWATLDFTVGVTPPSDPTISAALDDANQRVGLTVTPVATAGFDAPLYTVERSVDGETWEAVRGAAKRARRLRRPGGVLRLRGAARRRAVLPGQRRGDRDGLAGPARERVAARRRQPAS